MFLRQSRSLDSCRGRNVLSSRSRSVRKKSRSSGKRRNSNAKNAIRWNLGLPSYVDKRGVIDIAATRRGILDEVRNYLNPTYEDRDLTLQNLCAQMMIVGQEERTPGGMMIVHHLQPHLSVLPCRMVSLRGLAQIETRADHHLTTTPRRRRRVRCRHHRRQAPHRRNFLNSQLRTSRQCRMTKYPLSGRVILVWTRRSVRSVK